MKRLVIIMMLLVFASFAIAGPQDYSGLIGHWKADGNALDSAGSNHGTLIGDATYAAGKDGQAFSLDGSGDFVNLTDVSLIDGLTTITVSAWVKPTTSSSNVFVSKFVGTSNVGMLLYQSSDKRLRWSFGVNWNPVDFLNPNLNDGEWHHIVGVANGTHVRLYKDGVEVGTAQPETDAMPDIPNPLRIGYANDVYYQTGNIDDVAIWNRALNSNEILELYNSYGEQETIPEVSNRALQIFVVLILALLIGALFLRKH